METKLLTTSENDIALAGQIVKNGGLVAFPTETVYGLGANAFDETAVKNIFEAKGRPNDNPLIVHVSDINDIAQLVKEIPPKAQALFDAFFPGPLTVILPKSEKIGATVSGGLDTVGVRMPKNKTAQSVIRAAGVPIAAPSANISGLPSPTRAKYVKSDMMGRVDAIVDGGDCDFGIESTVITLSCEPPILLRPGAVTREDIETVIGKIDVSNAVLEKMDNDETAASPGMKYKHYAPKARVFLVNGDRAAFEHFVNQRGDAFALCFEEDDVKTAKVTYGKENDPLSQAKSLFDALRKLDELGVKKVYAHAPKKSGVSLAVYNRLVRAAAFREIDLTKPFLIGLTGQTGSGKGFVGEYLETLGFNVLDSDVYSKKLTKKNSPIFAKLQAEFGDDIIKDDHLDRPLLAKRAFESKEKTEKLNSIMHPAIIALCEKDAWGTLCVLDAPLLFECGGEKKCYKTIAVIAPFELRLERILQRDGITKNEALERMMAQNDEEYYIQNSDFTVINDGRDIESQIDRIMEVIL